MVNIAMKTTLLAVAVAALTLPTSSAPTYANTQAYGFLQKNWSHHPVGYSLAHGPLSHWALSLNGHLKQGISSIKHATLGLKHGLKHGGLLGLKHSLLSKKGGFLKQAKFGHGGFTKYANIGPGHVAFGAYGGVGQPPLIQNNAYGRHPLAGQEFAPLLGPPGLAAYGGTPLLGQPGLATHEGAPLVGYPGYAIGGSDVKVAVPLSEYQNFPVDG